MKIWEHKKQETLMESSPLMRETLEMRVGEEVKIKVEISDGH